MAFNKLSKISYQTQARSSARDLTTYRYKKCDVIRDGDIARLTFRRFKYYYVPSGDAIEQILPPSKENRLDIIANENYGNPRMFWAIAAFNRWMSLNPLRFFTNALLRMPKLDFLTRRI
jgi:hypothetical protein